LHRHRQLIGTAFDELQTLVSTEVQGQSLGRSQTDSFAIKRLIEEEIPIRGIEDDLLRADFDAQGYILQWKAHLAKRVFVEGKKQQEKEVVV